MDSDAFNSFCITCDQLCSDSSVYCSEQCKEKDENHSMSILQSYNADTISPLLTPSLYQPAQQMPQADSIGSPLLLPARVSESESEFGAFALNYPMSQAQPLNAARTMSLTSQNYRLWLSGVL